MNKKKKSKLKIACVITISLSLFSFLGTSHADTYVGGNITVDTTWYANSSPYIVTSDVTVKDCATLTIEAGVEVKFEPGTGLNLGSGTTNEEFGILRAIGSEDYPITFTSNAPSPAPGDWKGIHFKWNPQEGCSGPFNKLQYCTIEYGGIEGYYGQRGNISLCRSDVEINHCTIQESLHDGIYIYFETSSIILTNNEISYNIEYGIFTESDSNGTQLTLNSNTFTENGSHPLHIPLATFDGQNSYINN